MINVATLSRLLQRERILVNLRKGQIFFRLKLDFGIFVINRDLQDLKFLFFFLFPPFFEWTTRGT